MKGSELIKRILAADPTGELEVCVGNVDIHFVSKEPAYYDGCLQVLKRDPTAKYYNIIGAEMRAHGDKIQIHTLSIADMLLNTPDAEVTFDTDARHLRGLVEQWRAEAKEE